MSVKAALQILDVSYAQINQTIEGQDLNIVAHLDSGWKIKDILTHLTFVDQSSTLLLEGFIEDREPDIPEEWQKYGANDFIHEERKDYSVARVLAEFEAARNELKAAYQRIPGDRETEKFMAPWQYHYTPEWFAQMLADHAAIHQQEIVRALAKVQKAG